jgi:hypothetical protein
MDGSGATIKTETEIVPKGLNRGKRLDPVPVLS